MDSHLDARASQPFGACTDLKDLRTLLSTTGSVIAPRKCSHLKLVNKGKRCVNPFPNFKVNAWLGGFCTQTCSPAILDDATKTFDAGCSSDVSSGISLAVSRRVWWSWEFQSARTSGSVTKPRFCFFSSAKAHFGTLPISRSVSIFLSGTIPKSRTLPLAVLRLPQIRRTVYRPSSLKFKMSPERLLPSQQVSSLRCPIPPFPDRLLTLLNTN